MDFRRSRAKIFEAIRDFFSKEGFLETDTPTFVLSPGMEPHIRPFRISDCDAFLPTSPEFAMKRLLAQGYDRIYQICKAYRNEPLSTTHNPEFAMLEWYRGHSGFEAIMDDMENLFVHVAKSVQQKEQNVARPWLRFTVEECFQKFAGIEITTILDDLKRDEDLFFRIMMNDVEPKLAKLGRPVIVYLYPENHAALSNLITDSRDFRWAKRFEVYAGGFELANGFDELADPVEQRRRFVHDMEVRKQVYGDAFPPNPIDLAFLESLKTMPPSGGVALGVDRLVMYFTGATSINDVLWLPSYVKERANDE